MHVWVCLRKIVCMIYREASEFQNIYMTSCPYHINTISLSESISFLPDLYANSMGLGCTPPGVAHRPNRNGCDSGAFRVDMEWYILHLIYTYTTHIYIYAHLFIFVIMNKQVRMICTLFKKTSMSSSTISGILYVAYVCHLCVWCLRACGQSVTNCTCRIKSILFKKFKTKAFHEYNREIGQTNKDSEQ